MSLLSRFFGKDTDGYIEPGQLAAALSGTAPPLLIDVRNPDEFAGPLGHIAGARNIPLPAFAGQAQDLVGQDRPIVVVCHSDRRSSVAASHLRQLGVTDVVVLRGGMQAWRSAGQTG